MVELRLDPKLRSRVDPSDVVQEVHLEACRRLSAYLLERPLPFRLWLRQIAYDRTVKAAGADEPSHALLEGSAAAGNRVF